uniref:Senescence regulator n=1 Tax=Chenopodium quinoa TaxID=63459 RepID=A0A803NEH5_CHEQI
MVTDTSENHHHHNHIREWDSRATVESGRRRVGVGVTCHQDDRHVGGLSLAFEDKAPPPSSRRILHQYGGATGASRGPRVDTRHVASSAPVNVPDWSKILRVNSAESCVDSDEDDPVGDSAVEPPHEYLARSRKMNAFSVFEGVGRTLKGRDMTRVRDAIWSQTGFEG